MSTQTIAERVAAAAERSPEAGRALEAQIRSELLDRALEATDSRTFTDEELQHLPREIVARLWRRTYADIVAAMAPVAELEAWAAAMSEKFGDPVSVFGHQVGWLVGLRLVLWGEEPRHWPAAWDQADVDRAATWLAGKHPRQVVYADGSSPNPGFLGVGL